MKTRNGRFKYQRQKFEHKRHTGRKLIDKEYNRIRNVVKPENKLQLNQLNSLFVSNVKTIKRKYNVTNVGKSERCWTQFYNKNK